ncbi:hypothetical protein BDR07DRAFT_1414873, partial [Suillus spraguei]
MPYQLFLPCHTNWLRLLVAQESQQSTFRVPNQCVEDFEKLHEYHGRKRKEFEERIIRTKFSIIDSVCKQPKL